MSAPFVRAVGVLVGDALTILVFLWIGWWVLLAAALLLLIGLKLQGAL